MASRLLAVGVDSASVDLIDELIQHGALPRLAELRARSARARLQSGPAHRHGMLWPQFHTGRRAELTGEWLRLTFDPDTYEAFQEPARHTIAGAPPFWEQAGLRTVTFDVPRTTISGPGVHVTAWGAHAPLYERASSPEGLLRELDERFGPHPAYDNDYGCGWHDPRRLDRLTAALVTGAHRRADAARHLVARFPDWELFVTVMSETHSASEFMWHAVDTSHPLAEYDPAARTRLEVIMRAVDDAIGGLADAAPPEAVVLVFALDGMKASPGDLPSIVLLPELLHREQFGEPLVRDPDQAAWRQQGYPPLVPRRGHPWRDALDARVAARGDGLAGEGWSRRLVHHLPGYEAARLTRLGRWLLERLKGERLGALGEPIAPEAPDAASASGRIDADELLFTGHYRRFRPSMRSFVLPSFGDGYVRVNLVGRERHGIVGPERYEDECRRIEALVRTLRDPRTGRPVVDQVEWLDADRALDPERRRYADVVVHWTHPVDAFEHPMLGTIGPFPLHRTGTHADGGFAWMSGPGIAPGDAGERSVLDLPPTILALLGRPSAVTTAGSVIEAATPSIDADN